MGGKSRGKCWVHGIHQPFPRTWSTHHVLPREWQRKMWKDVRVHDTIVVCPTGHANIHHHIRMIRDALQFHHIADDMSWQDVLKLYKPRGCVQKELVVARFAFIIAVEAGITWKVILD